MKSILIVHPEGNVANNPSLTSIVLALNSYYRILIIQRKANFEYQEVNWVNVSMFFFEELENNNKFAEYSKHEVFDIEFVLIIGVDQGINFADFLARFKGVPCGLISYEIFFSNEWKGELKLREINACKNIQFAISQDSMRAYLLSQENRIPVERIINFPVSDRYDAYQPTSNYLKSKLRIPHDKRIALYMGSIGNWTLAENLLGVVDSWPDNWVLAVHPRYGADSLDECILKRIAGNKKVFLSQQVIRYTYELGEIVNSADIGLVLYDFNTFSPYTGKNILFMGLSSGKLSMYLKYGIPVLVFNSTNVADMVYKYQLGCIAQSMDDINPKYFEALDLNVLRENCRSFFKKHLDFSLYEKSLLKLIEAAIVKHDVIDIISDSNKRIDLRADLRTMESYRLNITYNKMRKEINDLRNKISIYEKKRIRWFASKIYKSITTISQRLFASFHIPPPPVVIYRIASNYGLFPIRTDATFPSNHDNRKAG
jgi:hypothetical protein